MLLRWEQKDLAERSGVSLPSIKRLETEPGELAAHARTVDALRSAIEAAGVIFVLGNGEGPGVRRRRYVPGDVVRFKPGYVTPLEYGILADELGTVQQVQPHPPPTGPTYRMVVKFDQRGDRPEWISPYIFEFEFELVRASQE